MLVLQAFFLWLIVSTLLIGAAMLFHELFPKESPWLGFIVPPLALVLLMNFIEHGVAVPILVFLLPVLLGGTAWLLFFRKAFKEPLYLPSFVFLVTFAFTFGVRCLRPDISNGSDGISDLHMVTNYLQGQTIPPVDKWLPPYPFEWYYSLQQYAASVVGRLLDVKAGVAYNVSHALLSALTCVVAAGAAFRFSGGVTWITLAVPFLIEAATTGASVYVILFVHNPGVWLASDLSGGMTDHNFDNNWLFRILDADPRRYPLRLQTPGFWTWRDEYHANASGHFLTLLSVYMIGELTEIRRSVWPWVMAALIPLLAATASSWALPITVLLCWGVLPIALLCGRRPATPELTIPILIGSLMLVWPAFYNVTSTPEFPEIRWDVPMEERAPFFLFLVQWWPIIAFWICGCICWRKLSFGLRWIMIVVPLMLIGIEQVDIESRYNMIEKMWGYTWGAAMVGLFPVVASRSGVGFRALTSLWMFCAAISLFSFVQDTAIGVSWEKACFHLDGSHYIETNDQKKLMLQAMTQTRNATYLSGKADWCYNQSPALPVFTGNRSYVAWYTFLSIANYKSETMNRVKLNDDFYSGAMTNRLRFLRGNNITGVMIWPDDAIPDASLDAMKKDLEPDYDYIDCRTDSDKNAGVFLLRPLPNS